MKTYIINIRPREDRRLLMDLQLRKNGWEIPEEGKKNAAGFQAPRLRNVECPSEIIDQIGGWTTAGVGQGYGEGYDLALMQRYLEGIS